MNLPRILTLFVILVVPPSGGAASLPPPPKAERFTSFKSEHLAKHISKPASLAMQELIRKRNCPEEGIVGYRSRKPGSKVVVVTVQCYPPLGLTEADERYYTYLEYPLTVVVLGDRVTEVDLRPQGFMYESGRISFITDIDGNNNPEFWLAGPICECDGEPKDYGPKGCDCNGGVTVEFRGGSLSPWRNRNGWNAP